MTKIINLSSQWDEALERSLEILRKGGVIVYPTDTVYGVGGDSTNLKVVERVYSIKEREKNKPLLVMVSGLKMLLEYFEPTGKELLAIQRHLPGPYAFILRTRKKLLFGEKEVGVRVPNHFFCRKLCEELGNPIITTSANISGNSPPVELKDLDKKIVERVDLVIDGGRLKYGISSTVVNIREKKIIRRGYYDFSFNDY